MADRVPLLSGFGDTPWHRRRWVVPAIIAGVAATAVISLTVGAHLSTPALLPTSEAPAGISREAFEHGLDVCRQLSNAGRDFHPAVRTRNPRFEVEPPENRPKPVLLKNAKLLDGDGTLKENVDIYLKDGLIVDIGESLSVNGEYNVIDVEGRYVTPGLVDQHSHMGVDQWPGFRGTADTNEMSSTPLVPMVRSIDGFDVMDPAIKIINSGGVTTSLVLPGSGNLMGGEAFAFKHLLPTSNSAEDMLVNYGMNETEGKQWRWMKMACGENAKRFYGGKGIMPASRLGEGWLFRSRFQDALKFVQAQDDWCLRANLAQATKKDAHKYFTDRIPEDYLHESLGALLRHDIKLNVHCYEPEDLEMMIRTSHEFGFKISTFHHALEAYMVADKLARENISVAIFASHWAFKKEGYESSVHAGKIHTEAGVTLAYKSDHPVLNAQHLIHEASKAHHFGLPAHHAISSVTKNPADRLGLGWRIGRVKPGYDADVVVWDRYPLELAAHPLKVYVDGYETVSLPFTAQSEPKAKSKKSMSLVDGSSFSNGEKYCAANKKNVQAQHKEFTITNIGKLIADEATEIIDAEIVISGGIVKCVGAKGVCKPSGVVYDLEGGYVVPGGVAGATQLGLIEIPSEAGTQDGTVVAGPPDGVKAADGLRTGNSKVMDAVFKAGVTTSYTVPKSSGMIAGLSALFAVGGEKYGEALITKESALHVGIGEPFKNSGAFASISSQIGALRKILFGEIVNLGKPANRTDSAFLRVLRGEIPLAVTTANSEDILKILDLKAEVEAALPDGARLPVTLVGGAEAWFVADEIAAAGVPLLLKPARCTPSPWEARRCRVPGSRPTAAEILLKAGVDLSIGVDLDEGVRELFFEAGWVHADAVTYPSLITEKDAIGLVSWKVAKALGGVDAVEKGVGKILEGKRASFVAFDGSPLVFGSDVQLVVDGKQVLCSPVQP